MENKNGDLTPQKLFDHLRELGVKDVDLEWLANRVHTLQNASR